LITSYPLSVFLYVKPDSIPKNPEHALEINRNVSDNYNSSKFHWIIDPNGDTDHKNTNLENKYIYRNLKKKKSLEKNLHKTNKSHSYQLKKRINKKREETSCKSNHNQKESKEKE